MILSLILIWGLILGYESGPVGEVTVERDTTALILGYGFGHCRFMHYDMYLIDLKLPYHMWECYP